MLPALLTSTGTDTDVRTISGSHPSKAWGSYENNLARREAVARKMGIRNWLLGEEEAWDASLPLRQRQDEPQDRAQQRLLSEMTFEELESKQRELWVQHRKVAEPPMPEEAEFGAEEALAMDETSVDRGSVPSRERRSN